MNRSSSHKPAAKDKKQTDSDTADAKGSAKRLRRVVDPVEDLVYKGGYTKDPAEIISNPAVAPQMLDDTPQNLRDDLKRDE